MERLPPATRLQFEKYDTWVSTNFRLAAAEVPEVDGGGEGATATGPRQLEDSDLLFALVGTKEAAPDDEEENTIQIRIVAPFV